MDLTTAATTRKMHGVSHLKMAIISSQDELGDDNHNTSTINTRHTSSTTSTTYMPQQHTPRAAPENRNTERLTTHDTRPSREHNTRPIMWLDHADAT